MDDTERSQIHATFVIERTYPVPVTAVWHALSDNDARDQWFTAGEVFQASEKSHEFRVGGHGIEDGQWHGGPRSRFHSTYTEQGVHFDGLDSPEGREEGTMGLLDQLGSYLSPGRR